MFLQHVTVLRAATVVDPYGDAELDWSSPSRSHLDRVSLQPTSQGELVDRNRTPVVTDWRVITAPGLNPDITPADRVELEDGTVCEVVGEVARWPDPATGRVHHVEFLLRRVAG